MRYNAVMEQENPGQGLVSHTAQLDTREVVECFSDNKQAHPSVRIYKYP